MSGEDNKLLNNENKIFIGKGDKPVYLDLKTANRHGLIAGATGTGKTITLQILAEGFARHGVPVFMADIKGDLSGISQAGKPKDFLQKRALKIDLTDYAFQQTPVIFWDLYGEQGHPIRTTIIDVGAVLLAQLLELNDTQEGVLHAAFKIAEDEDLPLLDLKDLRSLLSYIEGNRKALAVDYGNFSSASLGAIQRRLLVLGEQGGDKFFGEPALNIQDFFRTTYDGKGFINLLAADKLMLQPKLYSIFLLWLLTELFKELPEVGDPEKPVLVFFFDEAHLLFDDAPKALLNRIEQVVRLIRSKGVGIYFISQSPTDIPNDVLGQLGNRVQHALRAYTPKDREAVVSAAKSFRENPEIDTVQAISELGVGEALVSVLDHKGVPGIVERTLIRPPASRIGPVTPAERQQLMQHSPVAGNYDNALDQESAHERLQARAALIKEQENKVERQLGGGSARRQQSRPRGRPRQSAVETMAKSVARSVGSSLGRQIVKSIFGSLFKSR